LKGGLKLKENVVFTKFENDLIFEINNKTNYGCGMVYMALLSHKNKKEGMANSCFPSFNTLKRELNMSKTTIAKYINKLQDEGYLIFKSGKFNKESMHNESNRYYFPKSDISVTGYSKEEYLELFSNYQEEQDNDDPF